jgi:hypothetical protein
MFKKLFFIHFLFLFTGLSLFASSAQSPIILDCERELRPYVSKIFMLPEARSLIASILQGGQIRFRTSHHALSEQFGAYWDIDQRSLCVNLNSHASEGQIIASILFELHNAEANSQFEYWDTLASLRHIEKERYIREIEYIEYENSLKTYQLSMQGIRQGIFPTDASLPIYKSFEEHFYYQKVGGHSQWIGQTYDQLAFGLR